MVSALPDLIPPKRTLSTKNDSLFKVSIARLPHHLQSTTKIVSHKQTTTSLNRALFFSLNSNVLSKSKSTSYYDEQTNNKGEGGMKRKKDPSVRACKRPSVRKCIAPAVSIHIWRSSTLSLRAQQSSHSSLYYNTLSLLDGIGNYYHRSSSSFPFLSVRLR